MDQTIEHKKTHTIKNESLKRQHEDDGKREKKMRKPLADVGMKQNPNPNNQNIRVLRNKIIYIKNPVTRTRSKATEAKKLQQPITINELIGEEIHLTINGFSCFKGSQSTKINNHIKAPEKLKLLSHKSNLNNQFDGQDLMEDIMEYLFNLENRHQMSCDYFLMEIKCISSHSRAVLIDWLIEIQNSLNLTQETLYLTIMIMDRILFMNELSLNVLQLLGITCLFLVTKLEERFPPEIRKLVSLTNDYYSNMHLILMERYILRKMKFDLIMAEPMCFLNRFVQNIKKSSTVKCLSMYFLDTFMLNKESAVFLPSHLSAAAFWLACSVVFGAKAQVWESVLVYYFDNGKDNINCIMLKMLTFLLKLENSPYRAIKAKYSNKSKFEAVSLMPSLSNPELQRLLTQLPKPGNLRSM